ncbi:MAG: HAD-IA family hydrolase [Flavobacterium sp.]|mgnify:FL=1|jgi:putative hydrolase of the HAD superfamily|nr:HAD-IA family hydrolase [Flavobacterium sp.]|tara:strand:+ start:839 stop:1450 length:612 start_codon:yes stop_codon:yes gene_type:complete
MIKNIVFDFGDVFINLDKEATFDQLRALGVTNFSIEMIEVAKQYEIGKISTQQFVDTSKLMFPTISEIEFKNAWNAILKDFPLHRLHFLRKLADSKKYRIFLLSNTNSLHISWIQKTWGSKLYSEFKKCFEKFYLSHEIHLRKPNEDIYKFVLNTNRLVPEETFFIDDTEENTITASTLGIKVWNINPTCEDVVDLFSQKEFS